MAAVPSLDLVPGVLAGEMRAIARLLTRAEAADDEGRPALDAIFRHAGRAHVVGITGVPGSGKSTLVAKLAAEIRRTGRRVGIVAIDPSSPFSGGAILGDRIRMSEVCGDPGVFVRSMATRGALGGPSAGLLWALGLSDLLTPGDLTEGRTIAGTGHIPLAGTVYPIAGIDVNVAAAADAGASVFLVPQGNMKAARASGGHGLELVPVATFDDALAYLHAR